MTILYTISIYFYQWIIWLVSPFNLKASQWIQGRRNIFKKMHAEVDGAAKKIWVHCASLGEFEQGRPLIEKIKKEYPSYKIILTFFSPSGYEIRKNYSLADHVYYLPSDTKKNAKRFVQIIQPEKVFFVKYEFWYNYINELRQNNIPLYIISAIFREEQLFFKQSKLGKWYRDVLFGVEHFFVQNENSLKLLNKIGLKNVTLAGDTRFDRVAEIAKSGKELPLVEKFKNDKNLVVVGSSWRPDEEIIVDYINRNQDTKYIFAPHEIKESGINCLLSVLKKPAIRLSVAVLEDINNYDVLLIDSIGLLSSVYRYADIAYIGGGFGVGIHNTLEPAIFNIPVVFGPIYKKFDEAVNMASRNIAYPITNADELEKTFNFLLQDEKKRGEVAILCQKFIEENLGATNLICSKVFNNSPNY